MLYRYSTTGKLNQKAKIYTRDEHKLRLQDVDSDAVEIIRRLTKYGFKAYIVGGAIRDLLLDEKPKDFDIATNAYPNKIRRLFRRSRVIGRRFKLVHIHCGRKKVIEVSTFRSDSAHSNNNNVYGSLAEDAFRRDFRMNALFYCPLKQQIIDYVEGFADIENRLVRSLLPPFKSFREDPVRMIRAVKYASLLGFRLTLQTKLAIRKLSTEIQTCTKERLTEEMYKILLSGGARSTLQMAYRFKLGDVLLPSLIPFIKNNGKLQEESPLYKRLAELDRKSHSQPPASKSELLAILFLDLAYPRSQWQNAPLTEIRDKLRSKLMPLAPSAKDINLASKIMWRLLKRNYRWGSL